jgi:hypothetical protein
VGSISPDRLIIALQTDSQLEYKFKVHMITNYIAVIVNPNFSASSIIIFIMTN